MPVLGTVFTVLPNYNSEVAEASNRGAISSSMNIFVVSGPLFSYIIGPYTSITVFSIICALIPAAFIVLFFLFVPESPYYLVAVNDQKRAAEALMKLRSSSEQGIKLELDSIKANVEEAMANKSSFMDVFKSKALVKALIIALSLVGFQQFSGINVILFYAQDVFEATGSSIPPEISSIIIGSVQVAASFVTPLLVDRLGRRLLFLISGVGMIIAEIPLGLYFYLKDDGSDVGAIFWLPIACLVVYIIAYNLGFGPLPWTVMAEIFPSDIKSTASTATASFCWLLGFLVTKYFDSLSEAIGMAGSFWFFSGFCVVAVIFVFTYMIETKGKSFSEIQATLAG